jgi:hypothetical protein
MIRERRADGSIKNTATNKARRNSFQRRQDDARRVKDQQMGSHLALGGGADDEYYEVGEIVSAQWRTGLAYLQAEVKARHYDEEAESGEGSFVYHLLYEDGQEWEEVPGHRIRPKTSAGGSGGGGGGWGGMGAGWAGRGDPNSVDQSDAERVREERRAAEAAKGSKLAEDGRAIYLEGRAMAAKAKARHNAIQEEERLGAGFGGGIEVEGEECLSPAEMARARSKAARDAKDAQKRAELDEATRQAVAERKALAEKVRLRAMGEDNSEAGIGAIGGTEGGDGGEEEGAPGDGLTAKERMYKKKQAEVEAREEEMKVAAQENYKQRAGFMKEVQRRAKEGTDDDAGEVRLSHFGNVDGAAEYEVGEIVSAQWRTGLAYLQAEVKACHYDEEAEGGGGYTYHLLYEDGQEWGEVPSHRIRRGEGGAREAVSAVAAEQEAYRAMLQATHELSVQQAAPPMPPAVDGKSEKRRQLEAELREEAARAKALERDREEEEMQALERQVIEQRQRRIELEREAKEEGRLAAEMDARRREEEARRRAEAEALAAAQKAAEEKRAREEAAAAAAAAQAATEEEEKQRRQSEWESRQKQQLANRQAALGEGGAAAGRLSGYADQTGLTDGSAWQELADPASGQTYYYNSQTNESTWERPAELNPPLPPPPPRPKAPTLKVPPTADNYIIAEEEEELYEEELYDPVLDPKAIAAASAVEAQAELGRQAAASAAAARRKMRKAQKDKAVAARMTELNEAAAENRRGGKDIQDEARNRMLGGTGMHESLQSPHVKHARDSFGSVGFSSLDRDDTASLSSTMSSSGVAAGVRTPTKQALALNDPLLDNGFATSTHRDAYKMLPAMKVPLGREECFLAVGANGGLYR